MVKAYRKVPLLVGGLLRGGRGGKAQAIFLIPSLGYRGKEGVRKKLGIPKGLIVSKRLWKMPRPGVQWRNGSGSGGGDLHSLRDSIGC